MTPRRVHAGSNFSRPKFTLRPPLRARASIQISAGSLIVIIVAFLLFCCCVGFLIWRNKRNKKKRAQKIEESTPFVQHQYSALPDEHAGIYTSQGHIQELSNEGQAYQGTNESRHFELPAPVTHNANGFAAPSHVNIRPVELAT